MISPRFFLVSRQAQPHQSLSYNASSRAPTPVPPTTSPLLATQSKFPARRKNDYAAEKQSISSSPETSTPTSTMGPRRKEAEARISSGPTLAGDTTPLTRPASPTSPVQIPVGARSRETAHPHKQHQHRHGEQKQWHARRPRDVHSPDAIPPSVAALLAVTSIPPPRSVRSQRQTRSLRDKKMTVDAIIEMSHESEQELSLTLGRGPLDLLLTAPEDLGDEVESVISESNLGSALSTRAVSYESMPSLTDDSFSAETLSSIGTLCTPSSRRKSRPTRRLLEPVSSPCGEQDDHPLSSPEIAVEELDFRVFEDKTEASEKQSRLPFQPFKSAFKSNLTASLRALKQAARSFSGRGPPSIPPDDFLTRSILAIDPQVPYTDERRPPLLEEEPTAELRRYLNPTTARLEHSGQNTSTSRRTVFTASIQMQTYKIRRARSLPSPGRVPYPSIGPSATSQAAQAAAAAQKTTGMEYPMPGPRQREMRENSDFIRIAVMEMAMRKNGKLDDQRPGRARWALPPRKVSSKPYEIGPNGVPARWIAVYPETA